MAPALSSVVSTLGRYQRFRDRAVQCARRANLITKHSSGRKDCVFIPPGIIVFAVDGCTKSERCAARIEPSNIALKPIDALKARATARREAHTQGIPTNQP